MQNGTVRCVRPTEARMNSRMRSHLVRNRSARRILGAATAALVLASGCTSGQTGNAGPATSISSADTSSAVPSSSGEARSSAAPGTTSEPGSSGAAPAPRPTQPNRSPAASSSITGRPPIKALVIVEENHSESAALEQMPYLAGLADEFGRTTAYRAVTHPSLPNYLAVAGGSTFGVSDDRSPSSHPITQDSVFDGVIGAGGTAKTYAEAMPEPCALEPAGRYAVKHNPWAYFSSSTSRNNCGRFDVPAGSPDNGSLRDDVDAG